MANTFTRTAFNRFGGSAGKRRALIEGTLVIDTVGGAEADDLPASLFGLNSITCCMGIVAEAEDTLYSAMPDYTGDSLLILQSLTTITQAGTLQVETATVVAGAGATGDGDLDVTITSALLDEAEVVTVALEASTHTTAALIAEAIRTALAANTNVAANFTVGGTSAAVVLTAKLPAANDTTLNIAIEGTLGVTAVTTSTNTTAGVAQASVVTGSPTDLPVGTYKVILIGK